MLSGLATMYLSARILGVEGLGVLAVIISVAGLVHGFVSMPGDDVVTTFATRSVVQGRPEEAARVLRFVLALSLALSLVAYAVIAALVFAAAGLLDVAPEHKNAMLLYASAGVFMATHRESLAALRMADRVQFHLVVTVVGGLAGGGLLTAIWLKGGGITEVVLARVVAAAVNGLGLFAAAVLSAPLAGMSGLLRSASIKVPWDVIRFQAGLFWQSSVNAFAHNMDVILLARFTGAADVGLYSAAQRIVDMARPFVGFAPNSAKPGFSRQWHSGRGADLRRSAFGATVLASVLAAAIFGALAVLREPAIRIVLGDEFSGVAPLLLISMLGALPAAAAFRLLPGAVGRVLPTILSQTVGLAVFLAAMWQLSPEYGAAGAAWARNMYEFTALLVVTPFAVSVLRQSRWLRR